jgi:hypothetical protein
MIDVDTAIDTLATLFEGAPEGTIFLTALGPNGAVHSLATRGHCVSWPIIWVPTLSAQRSAGLCASPVQ